MDLRKDKIVSQIVDRLRKAKPTDPPIAVDGTWGSFARLLGSHLHTELKRPILFVSPHIDDADDAGDDLQVFSGQPTETFPIWEGQEAEADATDEIGAQRLRLALKVAHGSPGPDGPFLITTCIQALHQPVPQIDRLVDKGLSLAAERTMDPEAIAAWLTDHNFERTDQVDIPGQYAVYAGAAAKSSFSRAAGVLRLSAK